MYQKSLWITLAAGMLLVFGCSTSPAGALPDADAGPMPLPSTALAEPLPSEEEETIEFYGVSKKKSQLSEETLKWLDWYYTLAEDEREALSFIPSEFFAYGSGYTMETGPHGDSPAYADSLTEQELAATEELARYYFTNGFGGVEEIQLASDSFSLYQNLGIEAEYAPGNIIIYMVLTKKDKDAGNPMRSISIARKSKSDSWKVINSGY
ncbi:MAG: hypothetical protein HFG61_00750 [Lachnospiraceae bacterium]|nr:hypothetical protein [Lachnospiraceae bacterium]